MTRTLYGVSCKELAQTLIANYTPSAPFYAEICNRSDLAVTEIEIVKDADGACCLSFRVEDVKHD